MGLYPLHKRFGLKRFIASTYQAVSGAGAAGFDALENELKAQFAPEENSSTATKDSPFPHPDSPQFTSTYRRLPRGRLYQGGA
jgi:aspartate-semialdehyde dehydrogenase